MENSDKWHFSEVHIGTSAVIISDLVDNIKLCGESNIPERGDGQTRATMLGHENLIQFNKAKCKDLHLWGQSVQGGR